MHTGEVMGDWGEEGYTLVNNNAIKPKIGETLQAILSGKP
jgi:hypothetical protein